MTSSFSSQLISENNNLGFSKSPQGLLLDTVRSEFMTTSPPSFPFSPSSFFGFGHDDLSLAELLDSPILSNIIVPSETTSFNWKSDCGEVQQNIKNKQEEKSLSSFSCQNQSSPPPSSSQHQNVNDSFIFAMPN
ncbi:WRKY transcription factor [Stylosanthes scabra]|uniref:WRKY transcription factor n=1 Tax=Stylosanthes scabra TaxID=79078 RepID=A0ABU6RPE3_9FABA|nr:WRKY transcription factor [Stylosanthes scabra]